MAKKKGMTTEQEKRWRKKVMVAVRFTPELAAELRAAVYHIGRNLTVNGIVEEGARLVLARLRKQFHKGKPFPPIA